MELGGNEIGGVSEVRGEVNECIGKLLGGGIEGSIGKANAEGMGKVGYAKVVGFGKWEVDEVTASTRINKECAWNPIDAHLDGQELGSDVGGGGGIEVED